MEPRLARNTPSLLARPQPLGKNARNQSKALAATTVVNSTGVQQGWSYMSWHLVLAFGLGDATAIFFSQLTESPGLRLSEMGLKRKKKRAEVRRKARSVILIISLNLANFFLYGFGGSFAKTSRANERKRKDTFNNQGITAQKKGNWDNCRSIATTTATKQHDGGYFRVVVGNLSKIHWLLEAYRICWVESCAVPVEVRTLSRTGNRLAKGNQATTTI